LPAPGWAGVCGVTRTGGAEMPLARYFFFVGAALLALLFMSDAYLPKPAAVQRADADIPVIRINSDRKWPKPIVFDTSHPTVFATAAMTAPVSGPTDTSGADKSRILDAFAQLQTPELKSAEPIKPSAKPEARPRPKRVVAKKHLAPPTMLVAQHQQFGFFASNNW
jgi:hypothetical protein